MRLTAILPFSILLASCASTASTESFNVDQALEYCNTQVHRSLAALGADSTDYTMMPRNIQGTDSAWACRKASPDEWCSGFWPGILWYDFESSRDEIVREEAERYTEALEYLSQRPAFDHDLGFLMFCSYGNAYRLTGSPKFRDIILASADTLATLFNPKVGTILSWPRNVEMLGGHNTIMDNMINLEMLFWASRHTGDKSYYDIAVRHADNTLANHFREDNSSYHVISYNNDGTVESKGTFQGFADDSSWARGQAWGLYGYTMSYRETGLERYLEHAQKIAELIMNHPNTPEDRIPYWDYNAPNIPDAPRDTSAAAVMASALFELSTLVEGELSQRYFDYGETLLMALSSDAYLAKKGENGGFILMHATGHLPANSEIDVPLNYGDYYYLEAIRRYLGLRGIDPLTL